MAYVFPRTGVGARDARLIDRQSHLRLRALETTRSSSTEDGLVSITAENTGLVLISAASNFIFYARGQA
jgi:hypothetical protein